LRQEEYGRAADSISMAKRIANRIGSRMITNRCLLAEAHLAFSTGSEKGGLKLLREALVIGREIDFFSMFCHWQPEIMSDLCARALENGIEPEYTAKLIHVLRLVPQDQALTSDSWPWPVRISSLGGFTVETNGGPVKFTGKAQKKPIEMLKVLIAFGGKDVAEERIIDALWPDSDGDSGKMAFKITLHRLRKLISQNVVIAQSVGVTLDQRSCRVDAWALQQIVKDAECILSGAGTPAVKKRLKNQKTRHVINNLEKAINLYKGHFLPDDLGKPWAISLRERLKIKYLSAVEMLARHWEASGRYEKAIECCRRGLEADELAEELYQRIMRCHSRLGGKAEAIRVYEQCRSLFRLSLGVGTFARDRGNLQNNTEQTIVPAPAVFLPTFTSLNKFFSNLNP
jgi:LuxR family transcriptional regulator, maltose regulon positive regulatory protein